MDYITLSRTVTVYNYWLPDGSNDHRHVSTAKATLETIQHVLCCEPLLGTAQEVEPDSLNAEGLYRRRATGWGATG